jgi:hypothetical protein
LKNERNIIEDGIVEYALDTECFGVLEEEIIDGFSG